MLRSLYSGISGMKNMQTKLDVIGNNIANVNTHGFKKGRVTFKDAISQTISTASGPSATLGGKNAQQVGLGVETASIDTVFTEGSLQTTGRVLDLAISGGDGYFVVRNGANNYYTRAGNFYLDEQGYLVNSDGNFVLAYDSFDNTLSNIQVPKNILSNTFGLIGNLDETKSPINFNQTVYDNNLQEHSINFQFTKGTGNTWDVQLTENGTTLTNFNISFNSTTGEFSFISVNGEKVNSGSFALQLDDGRGGTVEVVLDLDFNNVTSVKDTVININGAGSNKITLSGSLLYEDPTENDAPGDPDLTSILVTDGPTPFNIGLDFVQGERTDSITKWTVNLSHTTSAITPATLELSFDNITGDLVSINGVSNNLDEFPFNIDVNGDGKYESFKIDFSKLNATSNREFVFQPAVAELQEYSISGTGDFIAQYSDGSVRTIASLALARFNNPEGLTKIGGNLFNVSENSGAPVFGNGGPGFGSIESGKLEMSNVDLTEEFTEMIVAQRAFQSNSRIITTSDEILQEIVNLKR
ncbi:flagellar hook protein FlgE [Pallidibacillus pasinlerensis]|uniref:Flagellar hook protein FlgE n=1 Tax=Pallidibacillus pasinlerensis TaxID=2703818 RepID=A0ABX0A474_9BACI|nr:flagellar hook protein FlgE [Pallidibacillus pasinlerensis]NCU18244.1 flagellar hook protein FlgE [Pallidibacillus pasinlerensis]